MMQSTFVERFRGASRKLESRCLSISSFGIPAALSISMAVACATPAPEFPEVEPWTGDHTGKLELAEDEAELWSDARKVVEDLSEAESEIDDPALEEYIEGILSRLDARLLTGSPRIRVRILEGTYRNASALPDGNILVSTSLLAALDDEAQLAFLLGHEIAHIRYRHSLLAHRYNEMTPSHVDRMVLSRRLEDDADHFGLELAMSAGYSAAGAIGLLEHLDERAPPRGFVSSWASHATLKYRLAHLRRHGGTESDPSFRTGAEDYQAAMDRLRLQAVEIELQDGSLDSAEQFVSRHIERWPEDGRGFLYRGEVTRRRPSKGRSHSSVRSDFERAVELAPEDPKALRALGLLLMDLDELDRARHVLERYLAAAPDAIDRKLIERYLAGDS